VERRGKEKSLVERRGEGRDLLVVEGVLHHLLRLALVLGGVVDGGFERCLGRLLALLPVRLLRLHERIVMIRWTGLAPWEFEFPFPDSLTSHFALRVSRERGQKRGQTDSQAKCGAHSALSLPLAHRGGDGAGSSVLEALERVVLLRLFPSLSLSDFASLSLSRSLSESSDLSVCLSVSVTQTRI